MYALQTAKNTLIVWYEQYINSLIMWLHLLRFNSDSRFVLWKALRNVCLTKTLICELMRPSEAHSDQICLLAAWWLQNKSLFNHHWSPGMSVLMHSVCERSGTIPQFYYSSDSVFKCNSGYATITLYLWQSRWLSITLLYKHVHQGWCFVCCGRWS